MKKLFLQLLLAFLPVYSFAQLEGLVVEALPVATSMWANPNTNSISPEGLVVYRVYAELQGAEDKVVSVFAQPDCASVSISTSTAFFNDPSFGAQTAAGINPLLFPAFPTVEIDSYLSIGALTQSDPGASVINTVALIPGDPYTGPFTENLTTSVFEMQDGAWFAPGGVNGSGVNNRVFLGQVTTDGELSLSMNIQVEIDGDNSNVVNYLWNEGCDADLPNGEEVYLPGLSGVVGCLDDDGCNYDPEVQIPLTDCFDTYGCLDEDACNYDPGACFASESCYYGCGCNDPEACNYDPDDSGTDDCLYNVGCTNPLAVNFDPAAECEATCIFEGLVYHDANQNEEQDAGEGGLAGQEVVIEPLGLVLLTNAEGEFTFSVDPPYTNSSVVFQSSDLFPTVTTWESLPLQGNVPLVFGVTSDDPFSSLSVYIYPEWGPFIVCDQVNMIDVCVSNWGNETVDGYATLELPEGSAQFAPDQIPPLDSISGNTAYFSFGELEPNEVYCGQVGVLGPTFEDMGIIVDVSSDAFGFQNGEQTAVGMDNYGSFLNVCAYDPNDKQVFPLGYEEPQYIAPDTTLEYLVRFQNTGNFFAFNVLIRDTISEHLDLSTFELRAYSHSVQTTIDHETREVQFFFEDIMLPDSTCCEEDSHGFVSFEIQPLPDLPHNTEINNTAHIFFDSNPAIVTNTTKNTIFICDESLAQFDAPEQVCAGEAFTTASSMAFIDDYKWLIDGEPFSNDSIAEFSFDAGQYAIELQVENPLCATSAGATVNVSALPEVGFAQDPDNQTVLVATEGTAYQWYLNGEHLDGETGQTLSIEEEGNYSVEVTDENGCTATSEEVFIMITSVGGLNPEDVSIYPTPLRAGQPLYVSGIHPEQMDLVRVLDASGKEVWSSETGVQLIPTAGWASGNYAVEIRAADQRIVKRIVIQ